MKAPEKSSVTITAYGVITAEDLESLSSVLNRVFGFVVTEVGKNGRALTFASYTGGSVYVTYNDERKCWAGVLKNR